MTQAATVQSARFLPAHPGKAPDAIDTPALLLDLDALERNLAAMGRFAAKAGVRLRPHAKSHKCPEIAHRQIAAGAVGICCQKASEAEVFVDAGIADVLITNQVVGAAKLDRLARLAKRARLGVLVDDPGNVAALAAAMTARDAVIDVYVEIDVGAGRCGIAPGTSAAALAVAVAAHPSLRFRGLHAYHGPAQHLRTPEARRAAIERAAALTRDTLAAIAATGLACGIVTGAGTGSFTHEASSGVWNELQPGSYVFMDADYGRNQPEPGAPAFEQSLWLLATVMSAPAADRRVVDAGLKASSVDSGPPVLHGWPGVVYEKASDEHGVLSVAAGAAAPELGDRVRLVPGHCDPTLNLHDWIVCVRGDGDHARVEALWPVAARGAGY